VTDALTVGAVVANAARGAPDATAAVVEGRHYTLAELDRAGTGAAYCLVAAGVSFGDVILVLADTSFDLLAAFVGCARAGAVFAPLNPALDAATMAAAVERTGAAWCLADDYHTDRANGLGRPVITVRQLGRGARVAQLPAVASHHGHVAFFTSGSTGSPKAALLAHGTSVLRSHPGSQLEPRGAALCPYPLFHMGGWTIALQQWHARAGVVFVTGTDPHTLAAALVDHEIERFNAIPALWTRLAQHLGADGPGAFPRLRFADTGTSPTSIDLLETIAAMAPNATVRVFYGSTEAGNVASLHHEDLATRPGSCGRPGPLTQVELGPDGELLVRGPLLFDGYIGDPDANAEALVDGWYHSGDQAVVDDDGYLSIIGRLGTIIRTGGEAVVPDHVEAALRSHPDIADVAVFGVTDDQWGELVWAAVVAEVELTPDDLARHLGHDGPHPLARHEHPRRLLRLAELPRTAATGQVDRHRLGQLASQVDG